MKKKEGKKPKADISKIINALALMHRGKHKDRGKKSTV